MADENEVVPVTAELVEMDAGVDDVIEDPRLHAGIDLPAYDEITDQGVLKSVREVFRGFNFDDTDDVGKRYQTVEQLITFVSESFADIQACRKDSEARNITRNAAAMARFWYTGRTLDKALDQGKYGTGAPQKLAAAMALSVPYIYQIRAVAEKLTAADCYMLGMRGCDSTTLRKLAMVKDDAIRKGIIKAFVNTFTNTADSAKQNEAKQALITAINTKKSLAFSVESTSDPLAGGSDIMVSEQYQNVMKAFQAAQKALKRASTEEFINAFCNATADFSIIDSVPDAQEHLDEVKAEAEKTRVLIQAVKNNLEDALNELTSLNAVTVQKAE